MSSDFSCSRGSFPVSTLPVHPAHQGVPASRVAKASSFVEIATQSGPSLPAVWGAPSGSLEIGPRTTKLRRWENGSLRVGTGSPSEAGRGAPAQNTRPARLQVKSQMADETCTDSPAETVTVITNKGLCGLPAVSLETLTDTRGREGVRHLARETTEIEIHDPDCWGKGGLVGPHRRGSVAGGSVRTPKGILVTISFKFFYFYLFIYF